MQEISFHGGVIVMWQDIHRSSRLRAYQKLVNKRIRYRTYFMRDNDLPMETLEVLDAVAVRGRGAGHDRAFVGKDANGALIEIPWSRIVEVALEEDATLDDKAT